MLWGGKELRPNWVVDESWSITDEFPSNTEQALIVTFIDRNVNLTLGQFETSYKTGVSESETFQITAEQFDTDSWDEDGDNISNLDEQGSEENPFEVVDEIEVPEFVQVTFDITAPAFHLDGVSVRNARNISAVAERVSDLQWLMSSNLPSAQTYELEFDLIHRNGDVILARADIDVETGINASKTIYISADQFKSDSWDDDGDGVTNLDESLAGSHPLFDETVPPLEREHLNVYSINAVSTLARFSRAYEDSIPTDRPYFEHLEEVIPEIYPEENVLGRNGIYTTFTINIDEFGTGSFTNEYFRLEPYTNRHTEDENATRTNTGHSILWEGRDYWFDSSAFRGEDGNFKVETTVVDEQMHRQIGEIDFESIGGGGTSVKFSYSLLGEQISDTECKPVAGTIAHDGAMPIADRWIPTETTISKELSDAYWQVKVLSRAGGALIETYTIKELKWLSHVTPIDVSFRCNMQF